VHGKHLNKTICHLISKQLTTLRVIGQRLDYIKIATADLKVADVVLRTWTSQLSRSPVLYNITDNTPTHVWLRFNKEHMTIVD
jgi:hypothetical protein